MTSPLAKSALFVVLTFALTWGFWFSTAIFSDSLSGSAKEWLFLGGAMSPMVVAALMWPFGVALKFTTLFHWRMTWWTIPVSILLVPVTIILVRTFVPPDLSVWSYLEILPSQLTVFLILLPILMGEEFGWRGYLLPQLLSRYGFMPVSIVVGLIWSLWHLPLFYLGFYPNLMLDSVALSVALFTWQGKCCSSYISWLFAESGYRIWIPLLFHTSNNTFGPIALPPGVSDGHQFLLSVTVSFLATMLCLWIARLVKRHPERVQLPNA